MCVCLRVIWRYLVKTCVCSEEQVGKEPVIPATTNYSKLWKHHHCLGQHPHVQDWKLQPESSHGQTHGCDKRRPATSEQKKPVEICFSMKGFVFGNVRWSPRWRWFVTCVSHEQEKPFQVDEFWGQTPRVDIRKRNITQKPGWGIQETLSRERWISQDVWRLQIAWKFLDECFWERGKIEKCPDIHYLRCMFKYRQCIYIRLFGSTKSESLNPMFFSKAPSGGWNLSIEMYHQMIDQLLII